MRAHSYGVTIDTLVQLAAGCRFVIYRRTIPLPLPIYELYSTVFPRLPQLRGYRPPESINQPSHRKSAGATHAGKYKYQSSSSQLIVIVGGGTVCTWNALVLTAGVHAN